MGRIDPDQWKTIEDMAVRVAALEKRGTRIPPDQWKTIEDVGIRVAALEARQEDAT